jgi:two-component system, OmpR family, sensor histidine kinase CpxA
MKLRPRSLFAKIFLWFCLTVAASSVLVLILTSVAGLQPFGKRWMAMTQDLYAESAVDFYATGGSAALARYLDTIERDGGIEGHLIDANGADMLGAPFPEHARNVYEHARQTGHSSMHLGLFWNAASVVHGYIFVMEAHPQRGFLDGTFLVATLPRLLVSALLVAFFCFMLARHIARPILILQSAANRMAMGDLTVRTLPAMKGRSDELATMATAFDSMAERIELLLLTQRQMLADISHELRSPLTRIGVSLELLRRGELDVLDPMQADLDRLNQMIGQILDLMRLELAEPSAPPSRVDLLAVLEEVVDNANHEGRATDKSVVLTGPAPPYLLMSDENLIRSCIENIVRNALQHSPACGVIQASIKRTATGAIAVTIEDSGPGVPEDALPHLFVPFFRAPGASKSHPHGSGLGLSVSARIVARYGGTIVAYNRTPHGLGVRIQLPACLAVRAV